MPLPLFASFPIHLPFLRGGCPSPSDPPTPLARLCPDCWWCCCFVAPPLLWASRWACTGAQLLKAEIRDSTSRKHVTGLPAYVVCQGINIVRDQEPDIAEAWHGLARTCDLPRKPTE
eukprot:1138057-Pelagomonas_calceolata.AAC.3